MYKINNTKPIAQIIIIGIEIPNTVPILFLKFTSLSHKKGF